MTKIIEKIRFFTGYSDTVQLRESFFDEEDNSAHIGGYMPIRSHREAFMKIIEAQAIGLAAVKKTFLLTGSFGTGKSHLCLMLANYFARSVDSPEMTGFFENWRQRDPDGAARLINLRGQGRYLVAICSFGAGESFVDNVLNALEEALAEDGAEGITLSTLCRAALDWIKQKESGSLTFQEFKGYLNGGDPDASLESLKTELERNNSVALQQFQAAYFKTTSQYLRVGAGSGSLQDVILHLTQQDIFKDRYRGLIILADEFGYALQDSSFPVGAFHGFAEFLNSNGAGLPVIFVGVGHRSFDAYGTGSGQLQDYRVLKDRVTEVPLQAEELEQIIGALIAPADDIRARIRENPLFTRMADEAATLGLFPYLNRPKLMDQIVSGIYPMHPVAVYCLTQMSIELSSDSRSVFKYFHKKPGEQVEGSYCWFAEQTEVEGKDGQYSILTADHLRQYFAEVIDSGHLMARDEVVTLIHNYRASMAEAQAYANQSVERTVDELTCRILDAMLVLSVSRLPVNGGTIRISLGFNLGPEQKVLNNALDYLKINRIIIPLPSGEFGFRRSDALDLDSALAPIKLRLGDQKIDLADKIVAMAPGRFEQYVECHAFNQRCRSDKRLKRVFATPLDLQRTYKSSGNQDITFWEKIEAERLAVKAWQDRYDGVMVFVICENEEQIKQAQMFVRSNPFATIITGVPKEPIVVREKIVEVMAIEEYKDTSEFNKADSQDKSEVSNRLGREIDTSGAKGDLVKVRNSYLDARGLDWFKANGALMMNNAHQAHDPADALAALLFTRHITISHDYLNSSHKAFSANDNALKEAISKVVKYTAPVPVDTSLPAGRGEIRYLVNVLMNGGVFYKASDFVGSIGSIELTSNLDAFRDKYPALADMVEKLRAITPGEPIRIWDYLSSLTQAPYGLGPIALSLFFAVAIRFLKEEIRIKPSPTGYGYGDTTNPEFIILLATGSYRDATIERIQQTDATRKLLNGVYNLFSIQKLEASGQAYRSEAWHAIRDWWQKRSTLEQTSGIYPVGSSEQKFAQMVSLLLSRNDGYQVYLEELKEVYGYSREADLEPSQVDIIIKQLSADKVTIESYVANLKKRIIDRFAAVFSPAGETYLDYTEAIKVWYRQLQSDQKDIRAPWQVAKTKDLLSAIETMTNLETTFLEILPSAHGYGFGKVDSWNRDLSDDYWAKFNEAFTTINAALPKVEVPVIEIDGKIIQPASIPPVIGFVGKSTLKVTAPDGVDVRIAQNVDPITALSYQPVLAGETFSDEITTTCTLRIIGINHQNEKSKEIKLVFRNSVDDYTPQPIGQPPLNPADRNYSYRNPTTRNTLRVFLQNLIKSLRQDGLISDDQIREVLKEVAEDGFTDKDSGKK